MSNSQMQDFIPAAAGLQAGTQGEEVERLQAFLGKFGYLNPHLSRCAGAYCKKLVFCILKT